MTYDELKNYATACLYNFDIKSEIEDGKTEEEAKLNLEVLSLKTFNTNFEIPFEKLNTKMLYTSISLFVCISLVQEQKSAGC